MSKVNVRNICFSLKHCHNTRLQVRCYFCILGLPEFRAMDTSIFQVTALDTFNFSAMVANVQPNQSQWLFNNLSFTTEAQFYESNACNLQLCEATFLLQLMNLQEKNQGTYSLLSTNSAGYSFVRFILCVRTGTIRA